MEDISGLSFEEILGKLAQGGGGNGDGIDDKEKAALLLQALSEWTAPVPDFKPGDFVRGKKLLTGRLKDNGLHIIMAVLPAPVPLTNDPETIGYGSAPQHYDLIIGHLQEGANGKPSVALYYGDKREWEPYPEANKLIETHS